MRSNLTFRTITDSNSMDFRDFWDLYESSFSLDTRRSLDSQKSVMRNSTYHLFGASISGIFVGFLSTWKLPKLTFIEHFAVKNNLRGKGIGSNLLTIFLKNNKKLLVEVEPPKSELQMRRIKFYEKLGFALNASEYVQPSYGEGKNPVQLLLMSYPKLLSQNDFFQVKEQLYSTVYGVRLKI